MNKWIKRGIGFTLFCIAFNFLEHYCHRYTDGFSLNRIKFDDEKIAAASVTDGVYQILNQPFHYLDSGNQCFVFASADGKYVLKFFKYVHHAPPLWTAKVPLLNWFKPFRTERIKKIAWKRIRDFKGYKLAYDHFPEETGIACLNLHPTENIFPTIDLEDILHIHHQLDLNQTPFILQKKASPIYPQFSRWIEKGEIEKAKQGIFNLVTLCAQKLAKNIEDDDAHFYSNFGFIDTTPVQIDPGHWILHAEPLPPTFLKLATLELKEWFTKNYPPLASYVEDCVARS